MIPSYSVVLGVDTGHLGHLQAVIPNWLEYNPDLFHCPFVVFVDGRIEGLDREVALVFSKTPCTPNIVKWPHQNDIEYEHDPSSRFGNGQRYRMLSGFVHVPPMYVQTAYWLKLDLDVVAKGPFQINPDWFDSCPAIIAHPWGYSKPANQMLKLDQWASACNVFSDEWPPLNLAPNPGSDVVRHKRIISWCGFFNTQFSRYCSYTAEMFCGTGKLPVPSQDGYMWYMARRTGQPIVRTSMKDRGWVHCSRLADVLSTIDGLKSNA